jgi:hypothetical protein
VRRALGLRGETVSLVERTPSRDAYGRASWEEALREVDNVLVQPPDTSSMSQMDADVCLTLHWPKADASELRGAEVVVRGARYAVVGEPAAYADALTPGDWNRPVHLRRAAEDGGR